MPKYFFLFITTLMCALSETMAHTNTGDSIQGGRVTVVENTELAQLRSVMDVLQQLPNVKFVAGTLSVVGRGEPLVFIGGRKLSEQTELWHTPASKVKSVCVITEPGAEYNKDVEAVIVINLRPDAKDGFHLDELLRVDITQKFAVNNELGVTYHRKRFGVEGFVAWNELKFDRYRENIKQKYAYEGVKYALRSGEKNIFSEEKQDRQLTAKLGLNYNFLPHHSVSARYMFMRHPSCDVWHNDKVLCSYGLKDEHIDYENPVKIDNTLFSHSNTPKTRHDFSLEYNGTIGNWKLHAGHNTVSNDVKETSSNNDGIAHFNRDEKLYRTFANADFRFWHGVLSFGGEHNYHSMDVFKNNAVRIVDQVHGDMYDRLWAAFANVQQKIGIFNLSAGLRYEDEYFFYKALEDDMGVLFSHLSDFKFDRDHTHFFPNASLSVQLGVSLLSLSYVESSAKPKMENIRVNVMPSMSIDNYYLNTEHIKTTALNWSWRWLVLRATHRFYSNPIYPTTDGAVNFIGKDYHALDLNMVINPRFPRRNDNFTPSAASFSYSPVFLVHYHKQWMETDIPNGLENLNAPVLQIQWDNMFTFPHDWYVRLNADWRSRGYDRNVRYYRCNFGMNASVQKNFLHNALSLELRAENLLHTAYDDVTIYNLRKLKESVGYKISLPTMLSFSVRYKM